MIDSPVRRIALEEVITVSGEGEKRSEAGTFASFSFLFSELWPLVGSVRGIDQKNCRRFHKKSKAIEIAQRQAARRP